MSKKWLTFCPGKDYGTLEGDERKLVLGVLRTLAPDLDKHFDDQGLLEAVGDLVTAGLVEIWFRQVKGGIEVTYDLHRPATEGAVH